MENYFYPISSADNIGASSYFLNIHGTKIIFDCGARQNAILSFPDYSALLGPHISGFDEIKYIFISHAHYDHIGSLPKLALQAMNARIFTTKTTKELIRLQLLVFDRNSKLNEPEKLRLRKREMIETVMDRIEEVPVLKKVKLEELSFTFYPAGHMAGAVMTMIESQEQRVMYTGDFSTQKLMGINEPDFQGARPDVLIMNATNGFRYKANTKFDYKSLERKIKQKLARGSNVLLQSNSIPKQLDLFYALKLMDLPVKAYLDQTSYPIAKAFSETGYQVFTDRLSGCLEPPKHQHVMISQAADPRYEIICVDYYSIHASFSDLINLVYQFMPKKVFAVHYQIQEDSLCFIDDLKIQDRYHGDIYLCKQNREYEL